MRSFSGARTFQRFPASKGTIPVAVLTTSTFDASSADPTTIMFGQTGTEASAVKWALKDVDGDGDFDLILRFRIQQTGIISGDTEANLKGKTFSGIDIIGKDSIITVSKKR